jgi:hypothetical protein
MSQLKDFLSIIFLKKIKHFIYEMKFSNEIFKEDLIGKLYFDSTDKINNFENLFKNGINQIYDWDTRHNDHLSIDDEIILANHNAKSFKAYDKDIYRLIEVTYVPLDASKPLTKYKLNVLKNGSINDLCNSLVEYVQVSKQSIAICDIYNSKIFHLYEQSEPVSNIREKDEIYAYQLSTNYNNNSKDYFKFYFYLKSKRLINLSLSLSIL